MTFSPQEDPLGRHFRAHARQPVRHQVTLLGLRSVSEAPAVLSDLSLAGAGFESAEPLQLGERFQIAFATPTQWDPLVVTAIVCWTRQTESVDTHGRVRIVTRAGVSFDYSTPDAVLAMYEMLAAIVYD